MREVSKIARVKGVKMGFHSRCGFVVLVDEAAEAVAGLDNAITP
jgi:hypothetical protein